MTIFRSTDKARSLTEDGSNAPTPKVETNPKIDYASQYLLHRKMDDLKAMRKDSVAIRLDGNNAFYQTTAGYLLLLKDYDKAITCTRPLA